MKDLTTMSVRISGLILIIFTASKLPAHALAYAVRPNFGILFYWLPLLIPVILGLYLYRYSDSVSRQITSSLPERFRLEKPREILFIGCILIGVVLLFYSLSDIVFHVATALMLEQSPDYELSLATFDYASTIATVIELLFSLMLIFRTTFFLDFVYSKSK